MSDEQPQGQREPTSGDEIAGKYRLEHRLGRGGMGVVFAARNLELGERVAIKLLGGEQTPEMLQRFTGEARAAARIRSEHIVRVFDTGRTELGVPYLVMEYLEGEDLSRWIRREGAIEPSVAVSWILETCEALAEAHSQGIVHRDLKPQNLFLAQRADGTSRIKLLDFGIAKLPGSIALTNTNTVMGSPVYMAPEQLASTRNVDARADVWALGVVLYEMLTARAPFNAETVVEVAVRVREQPHWPVTRWQPEVPAGLSAVIDRCLAKSRERRWSNVADLARALEPYASAESKQLVARIERICGGPSSAPASSDPLSYAETLLSERAQPGLATTGALSISTMLAPSTLRSGSSSSKRLGAWLAAGFCLVMAGFAAARGLRAEVPVQAPVVAAAASSVTKAPDDQQPPPPSVTVAADPPQSVLASDAAPPLKRKSTRPAKVQVQEKQALSPPAVESPAATPVAGPAPQPATPAAKKRAIDRNLPW